MITDIKSYIFHATSIYDGDTLIGDVEVGLGIIKKKEKLRLAFLNAPEIKGATRESGLKIRDALRTLVQEEMIISTYKDMRGKYGRLLAVMWIPNAEDVSINERLLRTYPEEVKFFNPSKLPRILLQ